MGPRIILFCAALLLCACAAVGCKRETPPPADTVLPPAQSQGTDDQLTEALQSLERLAQENRKLTATVTGTAEALQQVTRQLDEALKVQEVLQQSAEVAEAERDSALANSREALKAAGELGTYLSESDRRIRELEQLNRDLLNTVEELANQINEISGQAQQPTPAPVQEDPNAF